MDIWVLDKEFKSLAVIDTFESVIWTDRYDECGDFEIATFPSASALSFLQKGNYLQNENSEHVMVVEDLSIDSDSEDGDKFIVTGTSLEKVLDRRIIWNLTTAKGKVPDIIKKLVNENAISPTIEERKIPNLMYKDVDLPSYETMEEIEVQFYGESLYETVSTLCKVESIGFKITLSDSKELIFELYEGVNRSFDQLANPYVLFSPDFDNLVESNFVESDSSYKNVTLVAGEGQGSNRKTVVKSLDDKTYSGLDRREVFSDAGDISKTVTGGTLSDSEYTKQLTQRGEETLLEYSSYQYFEGSIDSNRGYSYRKDFFVGDIIQMRNQYGFESKARILEAIISQDDSGFVIYPTIETIT